MKYLIIGAMLLASAHLTAADVALDLAKVVNMDFKDDVANDGKGGWSDQGPDNDMRSFDVKRKDFGGMTFQIIDPAQNGGRAVMTFDSPRFATGLKTATIDLSANKVAAKYLYLLHSSCWNQQKAGTVIGTVEIMFADGSGIVKDIKSGVDVADWWNPGNNSNASVVERRKAGAVDVGVFLTKLSLNAEREKPVERITFTTAGNVIWIVAAATLSSRDLDIAGTHLVYRPDAEWKKVDLSDIRVKANSAIDLSAVNDNGPAGQWGRTVLGPDGTLEFAQSPGKPRRFLGYGGLFWTKIEEFADPAKAKEYAQLVRRQGYNIVRPLVLDHYVMLGAKADLEISPERLDQLDRLVAELKNNGVYLYLTLAGYRLGFAASPWLANDYRSRMYIGEPKIRANWQTFAGKILNHVNPYTKMAWKDDPAIACVEFYNEQEWGMCNLDVSLSPATRQLYLDKWRAWLLQKYQTREAVAAALQQPELAAPEMLETKLELPKGVDAPGAAGRELGLFFLDLSREQMAFYQKTVREAGYTGLISQYNCSKRLLDSLVRWETSPVVSMNVYFEHPTAHNSPGSRVNQESSIAKIANYWRSADATRLSGQPLIVTEYNHSFWNPYLYENGVLFGAYSAFQNFSALIVHEDAVQLRQDHPLTDFGIAQSPVGRANQFIIACLFQRGDVAPAKGLVELAVDPTFLTANGSRAVNADQSKVALMTGFRLAFAQVPQVSGIPAKRRPDWVMSPAPGSVIWGVLNAATAIEDSPDASKMTGNIVDELKNRKLLPPGNLSDPGQGVFQSDTGEITLNAKNKSMTVVTPRSEVAALTARRAMKLNNLEIKSSTVDAAVAVCAMDGKAINDSSRLVLVYSTEAVNHDMELSPDRITLYRQGGKDILLRTGQLEAELNNINAKEMSLYALAINGERREKLETSMGSGKLEIKIDTARLKDGPAVFFELVKE